MRYIYHIMKLSVKLTAVHFFRMRYLQCHEVMCEVDSSSHFSKRRRDGLQFFERIEFTVVDYHFCPGFFPKQIFLLWNLSHEIYAEWTLFIFNLNFINYLSSYVWSWLQLKVMLRCISNLLTNRIYTFCKSGYLLFVITILYKKKTMHFLKLNSNKKL